jgi:cobalamin biosynthesis protein CobT
MRHLLMRRLHDVACFADVTRFHRAPDRPAGRTLYGNKEEGSKEKNSQEEGNEEEGDKEEGGKEEGGKEEGGKEEGHQKESHQEKGHQKEGHQEKGHKEKVKSSNRFKSKRLDKGALSKDGAPFLTLNCPHSAPSQTSPFPWPVRLGYKSVPGQAADMIQWDGIEEPMGNTTQ